MQNDILPPRPRLNKNPVKSEPMRSLRLQGHTVDAARKRLASMAIPQTNEPAAEATITLDEQPTGLKKLWRRLHHHLSKRSKVELGILSAIIIFGSSGVAYMLVHHTKAAPAPITHAKLTIMPAPPKPTTLASPLTGVQVSPDLAKRPVTGVMIENSTFARPQSGLQDAGVVYEAVAEGGITRFLALFQESTPQYIGPVRSLRTYFLDFATPYQASIAHVGGAPDALAEVRNGHYRDIDEFFNAGSYWRIGSRYAPHNEYTSFAKLDALNQKKGYTSSQFTPWPRKADQPAATPTINHIDVKISGPTYYSHYDYDKTTNTYMRSEGGKPHLELTSVTDKTGTQIHPKVILALVMHLGQGQLDSSGAYYSNYTTTGSGQLFAFQDGTETTGTWAKTDQASMFQFKDSTGQPLKLDAGQTWVSIVSSPSQVVAGP